MSLHNNKPTNKGGWNVLSYSKMPIVSTDGLRKSPFCNYHSSNWFRVESSVDVKVIRQNFEEQQYSYRVPKYLPTNYLLITKGKRVTF